MRKEKYTILYVDDEIINLRMFKNIFRRAYNVITVLSGIEALEFLKEHEVDVIITDQKMPEMTGVELLKEVNIKFPGIPPQRLMLSGYSENKDIAKAYRDYKLFKFISKPWHYNELNEIIMNAIELSIK
ncbi:MAG: response regulator [Salinivirgaceae bacterium]|nr:response regulator [Salinivirgaceae bacterium]